VESGGVVFVPFIDKVGTERRFVYETIYEVAPGLVCGCR
jgi:hypothetical protein